MSYKAKSIDFNGVLDEIITKSRFLEDPERLLDLVKEDSAATAKIMSEIGIDLKRVINDFYVKGMSFSREERVALPPEELAPEPEEQLEEVEAEEEEGEVGEVLSHRESEYLQGIFSRHVLTVAGLPEKEVSSIVEALSDLEQLSTKGVKPSLSERLLPLLVSPIVKAVAKLSKADVANIRELLSRQVAKRNEVKEKVKKKEEAPKVREVLGEDTRAAEPEVIDYHLFIDTVIDQSKMTREIVLETIGYDSELVYDVMIRLLHISPERVGKDLLALRSQEQIEGYINKALIELTEEDFGDFLQILKPQHEKVIGLMAKLKIDLKEALESLYSRDKEDYHAFVRRLFGLYGPMLKEETFQRMVHEDPVIATGIINQCGLGYEELVEIVRNHDEIAVEMERLFDDYKLEYGPFKGIRYGEIPQLVEALTEEVGQKLVENEQKVELLYGIYDIGLNYELEARSHDTCPVIAQYADKSSANPYEIALRLGDKLEIPLPPNFLRDMALSLAMSLKRAELVSKERFDGLLQKANQYRQIEGYYEITKRREGLPK